MKIIYVCSPLRGDEERNIIRARGYCRDVLRQGHLPIAPHVYFTQFMDDKVQEERERGLEMGLELLTWCDELWVYGSRISDGMAREIEFAIMFGAPVRYVGSMTCAFAGSAMANAAESFQPNYGMKNEGEADVEAIAKKLKEILQKEVGKITNLQAY